MDVYRRLLSSFMEPAATACRQSIQRKNDIHEDEPMQEKKLNKRKPTGDKRMNKPWTSYGNNRSGEKQHRPTANRPTRPLM